MKLRFTKMHGAGNDFIVFDATRQPIELTPALARRLGERRFGVGADQILVIERSRTPGIDFHYRIFNASGDEVEQCGNGARCLLRYVHDKRLTDQRSVRVETMNRQLELRLGDDGAVSVNMGAPDFEPRRVPFDSSGLVPRSVNGFNLWPVGAGGAQLEVAVLSMGNPHAVQCVHNVNRAPVATLGPLIEAHPRFPSRVNAGFMQIVSRGEIRLRVYERGVGETLACGTGACAAAVAGIRLGWLDSPVDVRTQGGVLRIDWEQLAGAVPGDRGPTYTAAGGELGAHVVMSGPAETVFEGEIEL